MKFILNRIRIFVQFIIFLPAFLLIIIIVAVMGGTDWLLGEEVDTK